LKGRGREGGHASVCQEGHIDMNTPPSETGREGEGNQRG
jgi:hypothetical protein